MSGDDGFCLTSPEPRARAPRPARVTDRDPYRVPGPAVVSVSGGRTSGRMLRGVRTLRLDAPRPAAARTAARAWEHAVADLRSDAERELAAMAARVDRIGRALEVE